MQSISLTKAMKQQQKGQGIIIDVREPAEFREGHIPQAINLPSTQFKLKDYTAWSAYEVYLICQTGDRARTIARKLEESNFRAVYVLKEHMEYLSTEQAAAGWSVDRQFRFLIGWLIAIYLIGSYHGVDWLIAIPIILCSGLIITAIIDKCYLRVGIAMLPWNAHAKAQ